MGQGGSSELRVTAASSGPAQSAAAAEPPLRWLRVSRASSSSLAAEWRWSGDLTAGRVGRCHLLFLRSDAAGQERRPMQRVQVDPDLGGYTMDNLSEDSPYRVCLQCAANASYTRTTGGRTPEAMYCVNVSTKQAHLPAIIGSCLGALCALVLVLALVLLSRRTKKYRKVSERQASTAKKVVVHEIAYQTENLPVPKMEQDSNSGGYVYDGSEEQNGSTVSDDALTPPPHPPPPPPTLPPEGTASERFGAKSPEPGKPELESLLSAGDSQPAPVDTEPDDTTVPTPPPTPPLPPPPSPPDASSAAATTPVSTSTDGRQVIQVNETDEYSIDLRLCESLSRQQSLKAASASASSGAIPEGAGAAAATTAGATDDQPTASSVQGSSESPPSSANQQQSSPAGVPSLYTQLIETL